MKRADMHIERQWYFIRGNERVPTGDAEQATSTNWVARARHPKDHHEFGIQVYIEGQVETVASSFIRESFQTALNEYLNNHPNGLDNLEPVV